MKNLALIRGFKNASIGTIMAWTGTTSDIPQGWLSCDGSTHNNADYPANGEFDDLILPSIDFTSSTLINLSFDYAYCLWTNPNASQIWSDTLQIHVSEDCGLTWQKIWEKAGVNLVTTTPIFNAFSWYPSSSTDWDNENINLSNYIGQDDIVIKFRNINQYENNLFLDNINVSTNQSTNIETIDHQNIFFPNPINDIIYFKQRGNKKIYNLIGQKIMETDAPNINISNFQNGIYILSINGQKYKIIKK